MRTEKKSGVKKGGNNVCSWSEKWVKGLLWVAECYSTTESSPELAYVYANEVLEMLVGRYTSPQATTTASSPLESEEQANAGEEEEKKRAETLRRRAFYALMPASKCRIDKAARLVEEARRSLRALPRGHDGLPLPEGVLKRLQLAERLHSNPATLLTLAEVHSLEGRHALAYVYHVEALALMSGGDEGAVIGILRGRMRLSEFSCLMALSFTWDALKIATPDPHANSMASAKALDQTPHYRVDRWPVGLHLRYMCLPYLDDLQSPEFIRSDGWVLRPAVPYTHLLPFLTNNVASIGTAIFSIPMELGEETRRRQGREFQRLLSSGALAQRLAHCEELLFGGTFHYFSWAEVQSVLDTGVTTAETLQFAGLWWSPQWGEPTYDRNADPFLELSTVRHCRHLTFDRFSAVTLKTRTYDGEEMNYGNFDYYGQRLVRPLFSNTALLAWLKSTPTTSISDSHGGGQQRGRKRIRISCSQLEEGVATFVRLLFEDFHAISHNVAAAAAEGVGDEVPLGEEEECSSQQLPRADGTAEEQKQSSRFSIALCCFGKKRQGVYECLREFGALPNELEKGVSSAKVVTNHLGESMRVHIESRDEVEIFTREHFDEIVLSRS